uniref:XRE family transcriptional regulator n=1 Tax=uncultured organism TaxID=155900 RepID=A0A7L9QC63_9ZZZZ|nr:hypothetical protein [uncultured organism]
MSNGGKPKVRLRVDRWHTQCVAHGLITEQAQATAVGMCRWSMVQLLGGKQAPGNTFIAAALHYFPNLRFDDLFEIVR